MLIRLTRMGKIKFFAIVVFFLMALGLIATPKKVVSSGSIIYPQTLDPAQAWDETSMSYTFNLFETLVKLNPKTSEIEPALALSWETVDNGKIWIFKLRKNVRFHDGSIFNAEAVLFSFKRQMDPQFKYRYYDFPLFDGIFENLESVSAKGPSTVVFTLKGPFYPFIATLTSACASIVSPGAVKKYKEKFNQNPVGTGPFMLSSWEKGKRLVFAANPDYWRGKCKFDEFMSITDSKHEMLYKSFRQRKFDFIDSISISQTIGLKNLNWVTIKRMPKLSITFIVFDFKNKDLQKSSIRKAIRYLWDDRILKYIYQDFVISLNSILPRGIPGYKEILDGNDFSMTKAQEILKKEDLSREIILDFLLPDKSSLERQMVSMFSKNLKRAGIKLRIKNVSDDEYYQRINKGDYDLTISAWGCDYPDPYSIFSALFNTEFQKKGFANLSGYKDVGIKSTIRALSNEMDISKRREMIEKIVKIIDENTLCIPVYQDTASFLYNNERINEIFVTPFGEISLFEIEKK